MSAQVFLLGISVVLAVAAVGVSLFSAWRSQAMVLAADQRLRPGMEECREAHQILRKTVDGLAAQIKDLRHEASTAAFPGIPKPGLNLSKRSQVLRLHRKGDPPDRIASLLEVPLQEVELLIKIHRIVIKTM
jgi:hypothetical protein